MFGLASELAERGHEVVYICDAMVTKERAHLGWGVIPPSRVQIVLSPSSGELDCIASSQPRGSVNLVEGIRSSPFVLAMAKTLEARGALVVPMIEQWDWRGLSGRVRQFLYRHHVHRRRDSWRCVLSIGRHTHANLLRSGVPSSKIIPFAYFLSAMPSSDLGNSVAKFPQFAFVGNLIRRKGVDILLAAMRQLADREWLLHIIGGGPERRHLQSMVDRSIAPKVSWLGVQAGREAFGVMRKSDCVIVPSRFDGWGAVVSEALQQGTPVICSDSCGSSELVKSSGVGAVFLSGNVDSLAQALARQLSLGRWDSHERCRLAAWSKALQPPAGAEYLCKVLDALEANSPVPSVPWVHE